MEFIIDPDAIKQPEITVDQVETTVVVPPESVAAVEIAPVIVQPPTAEVPAVAVVAEAPIEQPVATTSQVGTPSASRVERVVRQKNPLVKEVEGYFVDEKVMGLWKGLPPALQAKIRAEGEHEAEMVAAEVQTGMKNPQKAFAGLRKFYDLFPSPSKDRSYYTQQTWLAFKKAQDKAEKLKLSGENQL